MHHIILTFITVTTTIATILTITGITTGISISLIRGNHLSNTTCLRHDFFKSGKQFGKHDEQRVKQTPPHWTSSSVRQVMPPKHSITTSISTSISIIIRIPITITVTATITITITITIITYHYHTMPCEAVHPSRTVKMGKLGGSTQICSYV